MLRLSPFMRRLVAAACLGSLLVGQANAALYYRVPAGVTVTAPTTGGSTGGSTGNGSTGNGSTGGGSTTTPPVTQPDPTITSTLAFGDSYLNVQSTATATLVNTGSTSLALTNAGVSGAGFSLASTTCSSVIYAASSCSYTVAFNPQTAGQATGSLAVTAGSKALSTVLGGNGLTTVSVNTVTPAQTSQGGTLLVTGSGFGSTSVSASVSPDGAVTLSGQTASQLSVNVTNPHTAPSTVTLNFSSGQAPISLGAFDFLTGRATPYFSQNGTFPRTMAGSTSSVLFLLTNPWKGTTFTTPVVTGDFSIAQSTGCDGPLLGSNCSYYVTYQPTKKGVSTGVVSTTADGQTFSLPITATGIEPVTVTSITSSRTATTVTMSLVGTNFPDNVQGRIGDYSTTMNLIDENHLVMTWPIAEADLSASLYLPDTGTYYQLGKATVPAALAATPSPLAFGLVDSGATPTSVLVLTVTNSGDVATTAAPTFGTSTDTSFAVTSNTCTTALAGGGSCTANITYTPSTSDYTAKTGTLQITAGAVTTTVSLTGQSSSTPTDPYWSKVVFLLHMDGAEGGTSFVNTKTGTAMTNSATPTTTTAAQSRFGGASALMGTNKAIKLTAYNPTGDFTIEGWFMPTSTAVGSILDGGGADGVNWQPIDIRYGWPTAGQINFLGSSTNTWTDISAQSGCTSGSCGTPFGTPVLNAWNHYAVVRSGAYYYLYLNGTRTATISKNVKPLTSSLPWTLGNYLYKSATAYESPFSGYLDEFRFTDGVARYTGATYTVPTAAYPSH